MKLGLNPKVTLGIRDLDPLATEEEVKVELRQALQIEQTNPEVKVLKPNRKGLKLTVLVLPEDEAAKLEELSHHLGWDDELSSATSGCRHGVLQMP